MRYLFQCKNFFYQLLKARWLILVFSLTFSLQAIRAQKGLLNATVDKDYIKVYSEFITSRFYTLNESITLKIIPKNEIQDLIYHPNISTKVGVASFYKWYGMGVSVRNPVSPHEFVEKGESSIIDVRVNGYGRALALELSYQDYNGLYLKNTEDALGSLLPGEVYYKRSDITLDAYGAILYYIPNYKRHSIRASYIQTEKQLKSSGSPMIVPSFLYVNLNADSSLIPKKYAEQHDIPEDEKILRGDFYTMGLSLGYSYTLIFFRDFYVNLSMIPGVFQRSRKFETRHDSNKDRDLTVLWLGRGAVGYDSEYFFVGAGGVFGYNNAPFPEGNLSYNFALNQFRVWIGTRFRVKNQK